MPRPFLISSQWDYLKKPTDLDLHCLQRQGISGFSRTRVKLIQDNKKIAGYIGKIEPVDENIEKWTSYVERLEEYFNVNNIADDKKVSALLTLLRGKIYSLLRNLTAPDKPLTKPYDEIVILLTNHLSPKPLITAECFRFHKSHQHGGETTNYIVHSGITEAIRIL